MPFALISRISCEIDDTIHVDYVILGVYETQELARQEEREIVRKMNIVDWSNADYHIYKTKDNEYHRFFVKDTSSPIHIKYLN